MIRLNPTDRTICGATRIELSEVGHQNGKHGSGKMDLICPYRRLGAASENQIILGAMNFLDTVILSRLLCVGIGRV